MEVPEMIRYMRTEAGITQEYLSRCVNMRCRNIERYEAGEVAPTMAKFNEIAYACGFEVKLKKVKRGGLNV